VKNYIANTRFFVYLGTFVLLLFLPNMISTYKLMLFEAGLAFAVMGMGFNLLLRYTGILSFGHGAYFAVGAYTVGMIGRYWPQLYQIEVLIPAAFVVSIGVSALFGFICVRHTRIFFSILTLALSMLLFALLVKLYGITGGSDGVHIAIPNILGHDFEGMRRYQFLSGVYYYVLLGVFFLSTLIMLGIVSSPFGKALQAIRDNEVRAEMIGIRVKRYRWYAFVISGAFTGLAGAVWSFVNGHVTPEVSDWIFSGEIVFMTLLGGFTIFEGPIVGAILFTFLKLYAMGLTEYWMFILGVTLIGLVLLLPGGVTGGLAGLLARIKS
jgi:branched-chain amino acid transport system permease protein